MVYCENRCFISLITDALTIKKIFNLYTVEKENAKAGILNSEENRCFCAKLSKSYNSLFLSKNTGVKKNGLCHRLFVEESLENFVLKSVLGFLGGILLTYLCFMFLVFSLNFTLKRATYICMGLGIILSLGLAFSVKIRCTVFLCIPQLFTKRGRQALLAYAFILALSGPAKNTLHNVEVMSESLACGQEQIKKAENELLKCIQKPNTAAKKSIEKLLEKLNSAVKDFKHFILQLYKNCFDILETVLHSQNWLYSVTSLCNEKMGEPAQRCSKLLTESSRNCKGIRPSEEDWLKLCEIGSRKKSFICDCVPKSICLEEDLPQGLPVLSLQKQLDNFRRRVMNIFYVKVEVHQTFCQTNRSSTYREEYQGVATEIRQKTDQFLQYFDFMSVIFGIFIMVLFVKVIIYRYKFLTEDHYDNRFITHDLVDIDKTRAEFQMETLLPLEPRERLKYIKVTSIRLLPCERVRLLSSFVFLVFATFKIIIHMMTDSSLYWILSTVRRDERLLYMSNLKEEEPGLIVHILGGGLVAGLFQNVTKVIREQSVTAKMDPTPCLPDPVPPDWNRYCQILALVLMCWLLALCEPYGLRLRHSVMITYYPDRARERAIWLYNRIISNRVNFAKTARRQLRRKYRDIPQDTFFRFQFMTSKTSQKCLLCKVNINPKHADNFKCPTDNCIGLYCCGCFASLKICSICNDPADYGDFSDLSEEKDSSDDDESCKCNRNISHKPSRERVLSITSARTYRRSQKSSKRISRVSSAQYPGPSVPSSCSMRKNVSPKLNLSDSSDWESEISVIGNNLGSDQDEDILSTDFDKLLLKCQSRKNETSRSQPESLPSCKNATNRKRSRSFVGLLPSPSDADSETVDGKSRRTPRKISKPDFRFKKLSKTDIDEDYKPETFLNVKDSVVCLKDRSLIKFERVSRVSSENEMDAASSFHRKLGDALEKDIDEDYKPESFLNVKDSVVCLKDQNLIKGESVSRVTSEIEMNVASSFHRKLGDALEKGFLLNDESDEDGSSNKTIENPYLPSPSKHYFDNTSRKGVYFLGDAIIEDVPSVEEVKDGGTMTRGTCIKEEVMTSKESVSANKDSVTPTSERFGSETHLSAPCNSPSENLEVSQSSDSSTQFYSPVILSQPQPKPGES